MKKTGDSKSYEDILNRFHSDISNIIRYQLQDSVEDMASLVYASMSDRKNYSENELDLIAINLGMFYIAQLINARTSGMVNMNDLVDKIKHNEEFSENILGLYISSNFHHDLAINDFNRYMLKLSRDMEIDEENISYHLFNVFINSDRYSMDDKKTIIYHILKECHDDIERTQKYDEAIYDSWFIEEVDTYMNDEESLLSALGYKEEFGRVLLKSYFDAYILEDFQLERFDYKCMQMLDDIREMPSEYKLNLLYLELINLDKQFGYKNVILNLMDNASFSKDDEFDEDMDYQLFLTDRDVGITAIREHFYKNILEDTVNSDYVKFINVAARENLSRFVNFNWNVEANVNDIDLYFSMNAVRGSLTSAFLKDVRSLQININNMQNLQKICLISDYYNSFSDKKDHPYIDFIRDSETSEVMMAFDSNSEFRRNCIRCFVEDTITPYTNNRSLCTDDGTLRRINPFFMLEQSGNEAYQKKK